MRIPAMAGNDHINHKRSKLIDELEGKTHALRARELALLLDVTQQHIYKMASLDLIPSFRVGRAVRFDPKEISEWLKRKMPQQVRAGDFSRIAV